MNAPNSQPAPFDFSNLGRLPVETEHQWRNWLDNFVADLKERWLQSANAEIEIEIGKNATQGFDLARSRILRSSIAWELRVSPRVIPSILILGRPLALGLTLHLLGQPIRTLPDDRPLSDIEISICEVVFSKIAESLSESWPQKDCLPIELARPEFAPHKSRLWEPRQIVLVCNGSINLGEEASDFTWLLPLAELEELLGQLEDRPVQTTEEIKRLMEHKAREIPVPVTVELGRASISLTRLASLRTGDVVLFNQRINEPLPMMIDRKTKFRGWLGRAGKRHSFKISEVL